MCDNCLIIQIRMVLEMGLLSEAELDDILSPANLLRPKYKGRMAPPGVELPE